MAPVARRDAALDDLWERVCTLFDKWTDLLDLTWIDITLTRSDARNADDDECAADTSTKWQYRQAHITVYLGAIADHNDEMIESIMVHELVHVLINSMETNVPARHTDKCEMAVENVARALLAVHRAAQAP